MCSRHSESLTSESLTQAHEAAVQYAHRVGDRFLARQGALDRVRQAASSGGRALIGVFERALDVLDVREVSIAGSFQGVRFSRCVSWAVLGLTSPSGRVTTIHLTIESIATGRHQCLLFSHEMVANLVGVPGEGLRPPTWDSGALVGLFVEHDSGETHPIPSHPIALPPPPPRPFLFRPVPSQPIRFHLIRSLTPYPFPFLSLTCSPVPVPPKPIPSPVSKSRVPSQNPESRLKIPSPVSISRPIPSPYPVPIPFPHPIPVPSHPVPISIPFLIPIHISILSPPGPVPPSFCSAPPEFCSQHFDLSHRWHRSRSHSCQSVPGLTSNTAPRHPPTPSTL